MSGAQTFRAARDQLLAVGDDYDRAYADDFGQWVEPSSGPQTIPGQLPNITTDSAWDFTPAINQQATTFGGVGAYLDSVTGALNSMRR